MKRRDFLKLIGVASIAPSVLVAAPKTIKSLIYPQNNYIQLLDELTRKIWSAHLGIALEDILKDGYGWVALF